MGGSSQNINYHDFSFDEFKVVLKAIEIPKQKNKSKLWIETDSMNVVHASKWHSHVRVRVGHRPGFGSPSSIFLILFVLP